MLRNAIAIVLLAVLSAFTVTDTRAQNEQCVSLAEAAFSAIASCADAAGNAVCYGMAASIDGDAAFAEAGDTVSIADAPSVTTAPLDLDVPEWGMARVNVHANVPLSVSETGLAFMLIGDATLEDAVPEANAFMPADPVALQALVGSNLRSFPSTDGRVLASAPAGAELLADGRTAAGDWVHVTFEDTVAWVSTSIVVPTDGGEISSLPVFGDNAQTPMQSFVFTNGTEASACSDESPSMLVMQTPDTVNAEITANGMDIQFTDTIALRMLPDNVMQLVTLSGAANASRISVPPGFTMSVALNADGTGGAWTNLRPITGEERGFFGVLELMPDTGLYTALSVPTADDVAATLRTVNQAATTTTVNNSAATGTSAASGSCEGFRPTSPLDGLAFGSTDFYWDGTGEATQYRVNVFTDGELARSETIDAFSTTTTIDTSTGGIGDGLSYSWNVEAIADGQTVCTTGTVTLLRSAAAQSAGGGDGGGGGGGDNNQCNWGCD
ncbi:MAG: SH3 domain-containing protein [Chloroflexota bacterium]